MLGELAVIKGIVVAAPEVKAAAPTTDSAASGTRRVSPVWWGPRSQARQRPQRRQRYIVEVVLK